VAAGRQSAGNDLEVAWLAGLYDGEGCLTLEKHTAKGQHRQDYRNINVRYNPHIGIGMTSREGIERAVEILQAHGIGVNVFHRKMAPKQWKPTTYVRVLGMKRARKWLDLLEQYLVVKKPQAETLRAFIAQRMSQPQTAPYTIREHEIFAAIRRLNQVGSSETTSSAPAVQAG
jgi:intein/homing endonuclease